MKGWSFTHTCGGVRRKLDAPEGHATCQYCRYTAILHVTATDSGRAWESHPDAPCGSCGHEARWHWRPNPLTPQRCAVACDCQDWKPAPYPHPRLGNHEGSII